MASAGMVSTSPGHLHLIDKADFLYINNSLQLCEEETAMIFYRPPSLQEAEQALGGIYRAMRAWQFYPKGHPIRRETARQALAAMRQVLDGNSLSLLCGRSALALPDGEQLRDNAGATGALSCELFTRRAQKITFLSDLNQEDLLDLVRILILPPEAVRKSGGIERLMAERGIRTIWVNEFDLALIQRRRQAVEASGITPPGLDELENIAETEGRDDQEAAEETSAPPEQELQRLLPLLAEAGGAQAYQRLTRQALVCAGKLLSEGAFPPLLPLVALLASHAADRQRGEVADTAGLALERLAGDDGLPAYMLTLICEPDACPTLALDGIMTRTGARGIAMIIEQMDAADTLPVRRALNMLLVRLGEPAVPAILERLGDSRWYIVRNMAAVLGAIGSSHAVSELAQCLRHPDMRVAKEAIRSLAMIGGAEAERAIITLLGENNPDLLPQAITSLGAMKSKGALPWLTALLARDDLLLQALPQKLEALSAIGMIGDRSVVPLLNELLLGRHIVARGRWLRLRAAIATCLGRLGDPNALPALRKTSDSEGELGVACREAIEAIERNGGGCVNP